jgi:hypothetical protein
VWKGFFWACFEAKNGVYICGQFIFVLVKIKTFREASKTHLIVRIGLKTLTSAHVFGRSGLILKELSDWKSWCKRQRKTIQKLFVTHQ